MRILNLSALLAVVIAAAACSEQTSPVDPLLRITPDAPLYAKPMAHPTSMWKLPTGTAAAGLGLVSDGRYVFDDFSVYDDGVCGVTGTIFTDGSGDATLQTNNPRQKNTICQTARKMSVVYPVGDAAYPLGGRETMLVFVNVRNISNSATTILAGYGNRVERTLSLNPTQTERCDAWRWADAVIIDGVSYTGDNVWVERVDPTTYHVYTKDRDPGPSAPVPGANKAVCTTTGQTHNLSVDLYVVSK